MNAPTTVLFNSSGYTQAIRGRECYRVTFDTIKLRTRLEKRRLPFNLPNDLEVIKTPAVSGGFVFKICYRKSATHE